MAAKKTVKKTRRRKVEVTSEGRVYITTSFNNTILSVTNLSGDVVCWGSPGTIGFKGTRKSTSYAASQVATVVARKAHGYGVRRVAVFVRGPGAGRNAAVKSLKAGGLRITSITDITSLPHNGCRPKGRRRT